MAQALNHFQNNRKIYFLYWCIILPTTPVGLGLQLNPKTCLLVKGALQPQAVFFYLTWQAIAETWSRSRSAPQVDSKSWLVFGLGRGWVCVSVSFLSLGSVRRLIKRCYLWVSASITQTDKFPPFFFHICSKKERVWILVQPQLSLAGARYSRRAKGTRVILGVKSKSHYVK